MTFHVWLGRFGQEGVAALADRARRALSPLSWLTLALVLTVAAPDVAIAGGLRLGHIYPEGSPPSEWAASFARQAEEEVGIYVEVAGEGVLGHSAELLKAAAAGYLDIALLPAGIVAEAVPEFEILELPALFPSHSGRERLIDHGELVIRLDQAARDRGLTLLGIGWTPAAISNVGSDHAGPEGLQGKKVRVGSRLEGRYLEEIGAAPIMLALSETYPALQVGVLDATVASMPVTGDLVRSGAVSSIAWSDEFSPFLYATVLITSEDIAANFGWEIIEQLREIGSRTSRAFRQNELDQAHGIVGEARGAGIEVIELGTTDAELWREKAMLIWQEFAQKVPQGEELLALAQSHTD